MRENDATIGITEKDMQYACAGLLDPDDPEIKAYFARRRPYLRAFFAQLDNDPPVSGSSVPTSAGGVGRDAKRSARR